MVLMRTNMDKLLKMFKDSNEKMIENNNRLIHVILTTFCGIAKELSQKIKEATSDKKSSKKPREIFTQPQVKSALKLLSEQLDLVTSLLEDFMAEQNIVGGTKQETNFIKKSTNTSLGSFKYKN